MEQSTSGAPSPSSIRFVFAVAAVCTVVFAVIARLASPGSPAASEPLQPVELRALAQQATLRVAARGCGQVTRGSGVIVDGRLLTNAHVVAGAGDLKADQPIDPTVVAIISVDPGSDLAAAAPPVGVSLVLASPESVQSDAIIGAAVVLAGHADGGGIEVQTGVVSARVPGAAYGYDVDIVLIEAETRGGYSGGPVLDGRGNLVALLSGFDRTTGLTIAVPADVVRDFLDGAVPARPGPSTAETCIAG